MSSTIVVGTCKREVKEDVQPVMKYLIDKAVPFPAPCAVKLAFYTTNAAGTPGESSYYQWRNQKVLLPNAQGITYSENGAANSIQWTQIQVDQGSSMHVEFE